MDLLTRPDELEQAQSDLERRLRDAAKDYRKVKLGYYGGHDVAEVGWIPEHNLWFHNRRLPKRWWNPFGLGEPKPGQMLRIVAQVNPPIDGSKALSAGAFVRDGDRVLLCHKGRFTKGKQSMSLDWGAERVTVGTRSFMVVGDLASADLVARIAEFVRAVDGAKGAAGVDAEEDPEAEDEDEELTTLGEGSYWKVAPGEGGTLWPEWRSKGFASMGWGDLGDLTSLDRTAFEERMRTYQTRQPDQKRGSLERVWRFRNIPVGGRLVANRGTTRVLGIGTVVGGYTYVAGHEYPHRVEVRWDDTRERAVEKGGWRKTLIQLSRDEFEEIVATPPIEEQVVPASPQTTKEALDFDSLLATLRNRRLRFPSELVATYLLALQAKRFVILSGISGTGKTQLARFIAETFTEDGSLKPSGDPDTTGHGVTVKPYMLKYNRIWLPVDFLENARFLVDRATSSTPADQQITVDLDGTKGEGRLWRQNDSNLVGVFWPKEFSKRLSAILSIGDSLSLEVDEPGVGRVPVLHLRAPRKGAPRPPSVRNVEVIAVRPDWTDNRGLLGFYNPLTRAYQASPFLTLLLAARDEAGRATRENRRAPRPFFAILDEMNLARVEHYFSDFLSCLESGEPLHLHSDPDVEDRDGIPQRLHVPRNLFFTGTVNVDETTYMFSPKVLDRAFTLEFNEVTLAEYGKETEADSDDGPSDLSLDGFSGALEIRDNPKPSDWKEFRDLADGRLAGVLDQLNGILKEENRHFGYRVANEIARFVNLAAVQAGTDEATLWAALDMAILAKVLPKLHGTQQELDQLLKSLETSLEEQSHLGRCVAKLRRMERRLQQQGHTSFIE